MSLGPQVFVHALGQPDRDDTGRLAFGVGGVLLLTQLYKPLLDLVELLALFESREVFQPGELAADDAVHPQDLAKECDPIRLGLIELAGRLEDWLVLFRCLSKHGDCLLPGRADSGGPLAHGHLAHDWGRYLVAF